MVPYLSLLEHSYLSWRLHAFAKSTKDGSGSEIFNITIKTFLCELHCNHRTKTDGELPFAANRPMQVWVVMYVVTWQYADGGNKVEAARQVLDW